MTPSSKSNQNIHKSVRVGSQQPLQEPRVQAAGRPQLKCVGRLAPRHLRPAS